MNPLTKFLVVASDGVWEVLSNKQVLDIVEKYYESNDAMAAAKKVMESARKSWKKVNNKINFI
jgi:serine/threonine protein phosphatase PrpC